MRGCEVQEKEQGLEGAIQAAGGLLLKHSCSSGLLPLAGTPSLLRGRGCCVRGLCSALGLRRQHLDLTRFAQLEPGKGRRDTEILGHKGELSSSCGLHVALSVGTPQSHPSRLASCVQCAPASPRQRGSRGSAATKAV